MPSNVPRRLWISRFAILVPVLLTTACSQSSKTEEVMLSGDAPVAEDAKYPDFSKPLTSAMDQMTDEQAKAQQAQLAGLAARRKSGAISEAEYQRRVKEMRALRAQVPEKPAN
jgi:uncharacterized protein YqfA (UPF0365 family)